MRRCGFTNHEDEASDEHYQRNNYRPFHLNVLKLLYSPVRSPVYPHDNAANNNCSNRTDKYYDFACGTVILRQPSQKRDINGHKYAKYYL